MAGLQGAPAEQAQWGEISPELERAVDRLREKDRAAVLLRFYREMSFAEVGQSLGISEEAARKRVDRALEGLRGVLAKKGVVAALAVLMAENVTAAAPVGLVQAVTAAAGSGGAGSAGVIAKGAIKMMAWSKMKVAAGVVAAGLLAGGTVVGIVAAESTTQPARPTLQPTQTALATAPSAQLKSPDWWRQQAVHYAGDIADAEARGKAHSDLFYALVHAGDLECARASIASIINPQLRIHAHSFLAKQYQKKGDDKACQAELQQAGKESLAWDNISGHFHVIQTYLELGKPEEAIALAAGVSTEFNRNLTFQYIAAGLAGQGKREMADETVKRLPPQWEQSAWSGMANACADALRIDEAEKIALRLTDKKLQDRARVHLVEALVKADRGEEAGPFADRIAEEVVQATARATITATSAKKQSAEVLQSRIEKATTREEKLALYNILFARLVEAADIPAAEAAIDSMVKTIQAFPRKAETSKFGAFDDAVAIAAVQSNNFAVAGLLAKKGDREGSLLRLAVTRKYITELPEQSGLAKTMLASTLVKAEIALGDFNGARASLQQLDKGFSQSTLAGDVAAGLIKSGDVKSGMAVAELITTPLGRGMATGRVACELLRVGETKAARTLLDKNGDGRDDVEAFRAVGGTLTELGRETELQQWLGEMTSNVARAYLCMGAAEGKKK